MIAERQPIKRGDKLVWRSPAGEVPAEAASDERAGIVVIRIRGLISQCPIDELFAITEPKTRG